MVQKRAHSRSARRTHASCCSVINSQARLYELPYKSSLLASVLLIIVYVRKEKETMMSQLTTAIEKLEVLHHRQTVELSLNDLRILVGCFNALAYQAEVDGEGYLDADAIALKERLQALYLASLSKAGGNGHSH